MESQNAWFSLYRKKINTEKKLTAVNFFPIKSIASEDKKSIVPGYLLQKYELLKTVIYFENTFFNFSDMLLKLKISL